MNILFLLKLGLVPLLIAGLTLVARRWGHKTAGLLAGFPIFAGPVLLFVAHEQGDIFAGTAAGNALGSVCAAAIFCLVYVKSASRFSWPICLALSVLTFILLATAITSSPLVGWEKYLLSLATLGTAILLFPDAKLQHARLPPLFPELAVRMLSGAIMVMLITYGASLLGPAVSGVLSAVPLLATILAVFTHISNGPTATISLLKGMLTGFFALSTFCFVLSITITEAGPLKACVASLTAAVLVQVFLMTLGSRTIRSLACRN